MNVAPEEIRKTGDQGMKLRWPDGHESHFTAVQLRAICPCAACVNELTGERMFDPANLVKDLKILKANLVGNYALGFNFSDGHHTGIYSFDHLRKSCPCCVAVERR